MLELDSFFFLALFRGLKDYVIEAVPKITYLTDVSPVPEKPKTATIESLPVMLLDVFKFARIIIITYNHKISTPSGPPKSRGVKIQIFTARAVQ